MKRYLLLLLLSFSSLAGTTYMKSQFGLIFDSSSINKEVVDMSVCGEKFELLEKVEIGFSKLKLNGKVVYINDMNLSEIKPTCLNEKNKEFFKNLDLTPQEMEYWAQLNEKIITD